MNSSSEKFILRNSFLRWMSWTAGPLATLLNAINIISSAIEMRRVETFGGLMNKSFILLISFGDLLMGVYLVLIAYADLHFGDTYCRDKFVWLSSTECSFLGILSTIGTQLSLFTMTILSIYRLKTPYQYRFDLFVPGERFGRPFFRTTFYFQIYLS